MLAQVSDDVQAIEGHFDVTKVNHQGDDDVEELETLAQVVLIGSSK